MEYLKDNSLKDTNITGGVLNVSHKDSFSTDKNLYIVLKIEKLTTAIYILSSNLSDNNPLKNFLRQKSMNVMSDSSPLRQEFKLTSFLTLDNIANGIDDLLSFINLALADNAVSQANFSVLRQEYLNLKALIKEEAKTLNKTIEDIKNLPLIRPKTEVILTKTLTANKPLNESPLVSNQSKKPINLIGYDANRRDKIIDFIKRNNWSAINEIAQIIPGCSHKTIQRDLVSLLNRGLIRKKGERRWSRYALVEKP